MVKKKEIKVQEDIELAKELKNETKKRPCPGCGTLRWQRALNNYLCSKCGDSSMIKYPLSKRQENRLKKKGGKNAK